MARKTKPKVGLNELYCQGCWERDVLVTFTNYDKFIEHLKNHFIEAAPAKIIAVA